ncbi:hypothetical protein QTJ16_001802 [Diplocarpon rosae]|uniref:Uncharacterized protein n=1 Tax=Diplocarpon rosae TaxID=946125 RepID=A0AAD9WGV9_9HELO|nr:hypothetical protein QTJ16_001802 [Diplocarpon rosae]
MIIIEGMMLAPPERGSIIGRALWKTRYVVLGTGSTTQTQNDSPHTDRRKSTTGRKRLKNTPSKPSLVNMSPVDSAADSFYLTIYKAKGDKEFTAQYPVTAFKSCDIQALQHRKQSPSLPTLMLEMKLDSKSEKLRRRRSSRAGALSSKDSWTNFLLFRSVAEERNSIYEWQAVVQRLLAQEEAENSAMISMSPAFTGFTNPFANPGRPNSSNTRTEVMNRSSSQQSSLQHVPPRERPSAMISPSPSLRSRRSDLSSQASSQPPHMGFAVIHSHGYPTTLPTDLPSPASTSGYDKQFIEGWTSAQGRSSTLSSCTRGSNSTPSAVAATAQTAQAASTPPGPKETILDRAFQMQVIPGCERASENQDEKLSSIARFEALMREVDERKQARVVAEPTKDSEKWGLEEESEDSSGEPDLDYELELPDEGHEDDLEVPEEELSIPNPAQRALDYISGRRAPVPTTRPLSPPPQTPSLPFMNSQAISAFHGIPNRRPRTGTTPSQPRRRYAGSRPSSLVLSSRSTSASVLPTHEDRDSPNSTLRVSSSELLEKRSSSTSMKRLSFSEFAKRLSSTSTLLLVQTNNSSSSGRDGSRSRRTSSEYGIEEYAEKTGLRNPTSEAPLREKRCGWRGSLGVFGTEGGFL